MFSCEIGWNGERFLGTMFVENNARDDGFNNSWVSNRWSDFEDIPYAIMGGVSEDLSASLLVDILLPIVTGPEDLRYDEGDMGNWVSWNATDEYAAEYQILIDDVEAFEGFWLGGVTNISVDNLVLGSHNITIRFIDAAGNSVADEVWVSVMIDIFGGEGTELILYASIASIVSIIVLILVIKKMR